MSRKIANFMKELFSLQDEHFVHNAYLMLLKREPESEGKEHFLSRLRQGDKKIAIIRDIASSPEAKQCKTVLNRLQPLVKNQKWLNIPIIGNYLTWRFIKSNDMDPHQSPPTTLKELMRFKDEAFLRHAYQMVLKRTPDPKGFALFLKWLRLTGNKLAVVAYMAASAEAKEKNIKLDELMTIAQCRLWLHVPGIGKLLGAILIKNNTYYQVQQTPKTLKQLLACEDIAFVYHAYEMILKRTPDLCGLKNHLSHLRRHKKKTRILIALGTSTEAQKRNIQLEAIYNSNEYKNWFSLPFLEKNIEKWLPDMRNKSISQKIILNDMNTSAIRNLSPYAEKIYKQLKNTLYHHV